MKLLLAGVALASLCTAAVSAQDAPPQPPQGMHRPMMQPITKAEMSKMVAEHFAALDLNHDGKVTKEEIKAAREAKMEARMKEHRDREFATIDSNHDGNISKAEFDAAHMGGHEGPSGPGMMPPPPPGGPEDHGKGPRGMGPMGEPGGHMGMMMMGGRWFDKADANHDGFVTLAEAQAAAAQLFDKLDTNHDGTVSPDEMRAAFGGMREHGGWGHRGPGGDGPPPPPRG